MLEDYDIKGLENEEGDQTVIQQIEEEVMQSGYCNIHDFMNNNKYGSLYKKLSILAFVVFIIVFTIDKLDIGFDIFSAIWYALFPTVIFTGAVMLGLNLGVYHNALRYICLDEYSGKKHMLEADKVCTYLSENIRLPQFRDWSYGYDQNRKCGFVAYSFMDDRVQHIISLYMDTGRYNVSIPFSIFTVHNVKYYKHLKTAKRIIIPFMSEYFKGDSLQDGNRS
ncbi:MAG: hypothetical protein AB9835_02460 [Eubacteriales bacterium]